MSQILRIAGRLKPKLAGEELTYCKLCVYNRLGVSDYSTHALKEKDYAKFFQKKKKWKKKRNTNAHEQLAETLDARTLQLSKKDGENMVMLQEFKQIQLEGDATRRDMAKYELPAMPQSNLKAEQRGTMKETTESKYTDSLTQEAIDKLKSASDNSNSTQTIHKRSDTSFIGHDEKKRSLLDSFFTRKNSKLQCNRNVPVKKDEINNIEAIVKTGQFRTQSEHKLTNLAVKTYRKDILNTTKQCFASTRRSVELESSAAIDDSAILDNELDKATIDQEWITVKNMHKSRKWRKPSMEQMLEHEQGSDVFNAEPLFIIPDDFESDSIKGFITDKVKKKHQKKKENTISLKVDSSKLKHLRLNHVLLSYCDACVSCGIAMKALSTVQYYRMSRKDFKITDIKIYNILIRGLAQQENGLDLVRQVFTYIKEDELKPTLDTFMYCLSVLDSCTEYDRMIASFILKDMHMQGLDPRDMFTKCTFQQNEQHKIYLMMKALNPAFEPSMPLTDRHFSDELTKELNYPLPRNQKVCINPLMLDIGRDEMLRKAEEQFQRELDGFVTVESIFNSPALPVGKDHCVQHILESQRENFRSAFNELKNKAMKQAYASEEWTMYPFLCLFPAEDYVNIMLKVAEQWCMFSNTFSPEKYVLVYELACRVRDRYRIQCMIDAHMFTKLHKMYSSYVSQISRSDHTVPNLAGTWRRLARRYSDGNSMEVPKINWSYEVSQVIGELLFDMIVATAKGDANLYEKNRKPKMFKMFFTVQRPTISKLSTCVKPHPVLVNMMSARTNMQFPVHELPSLCPPVPFTSLTQGGNFINSIETVRTCSERQAELLEENCEAAGPVFDSLNILGSVAWRINKPVLDIIMKVFKEGGKMDLLDIPEPPAGIEKPTEPDKSTATKAEWHQYSQSIAQYNNAYKQANSLWWTALYKLSIANKFKDEMLWFPINTDFRGRTYPLPPHLNHHGQDYVRALMLFAKGKPIGPDGLKWLKLHLIGTSGLMKRSSNEEKLKYAEEIMPSILDSADKPLTGDKWWQTNDYPWLTLATCMEIARASRSPDPASYISHLPVHQDGSCNGLQHYAALGRDEIGAKSVNVLPHEKPLDVYSDVMALIFEEIEHDIANKTADANIAAICKPYLKRQVIKRTIMTTVYGVTQYGSRKQIQDELEDLDMPDDHVIAASKYLSKQTFKCFKKMFYSARDTQSWFNDCATNISLVAKRSVEWTTPLNFPCVQHYYKRVSAELRAERFLKAPKFWLPDSRGQKNGFAPNFIHSLDSTHMMLTALYCYRAGVLFSSVHDCFWTHACDVDKMNKITREQFLALHSQPILENLAEGFVQNFCDSDMLESKDLIELRRVFANKPKTGELDLSKVVESTYFFC